MKSSEAAKNRYLGQLMRDGFEPRPTVLVDSGNGIQALWRLKEPIQLSKPVWDVGQGKLGVSSEDRSTIADVEARSEAMMHRLGAKAGTQNIDRILRLPGTINLPNAKKRKEGRVACPANLYRIGEEVHSLAAFPLSPADAKQKLALVSSGAYQPIVDFGNLSDVEIETLSVSAKIKDLIRNGDRIKYGDPVVPKPASRCSCAMVRVGVRPADGLGLDD